MMSTSLSGCLGWDPDVDLLEVLRQYSRYFLNVTSADADDFAQGLMALEQNWRGAVLSNDLIETTLLQFRALEKRRGPMCS